MSYPLVRDLAAAGIPVTVTCRVLGFTPQAFYEWQAEPVTDRDWRDAQLINAAYDIHHDDPEFGYRFIADQLVHRGIAAGENRVARLCSLERIWSAFAKKRGLSRRAGPPVHDDLVDRDFTAPAANNVWLTDITEHATSEGKLCLCAIKDVWSTRIVGSMGRVGGCGDNAAMESFFSLLQKERARHPTLDQPRGTPRRDRDLDRADLPPPAAPARSRAPHPDRR